MDMIWVSVACLLPQKILVEYFWSRSVMGLTRPLPCPGNAFLQVFFAHTWYRSLRHVKFPNCFRNEMLQLSGTGYHVTFELSIYAGLPHANYPVFSQIYNGLDISMIFMVRWRCLSLSLYTALLWSLARQCIPVYLVYIVFVFILDVRVLTIKLGKLPPLLPSWIYLLFTCKNFSLLWIYLQINKLSNSFLSKSKNVCRVHLWWKIDFCEQRFYLLSRN